MTAADHANSGLPIFSIDGKYVLTSEWAKEKARAEAAEAERDQALLDARNYLAHIHRLEDELAQFRAMEPFAKLYADSQAERDRLREALDAIEAELGTLPLDHLGPATERAVSKAWAMAREKRPDPELIPAPIVRAALATDRTEARDE